jgi:hypothetical protein
MSSLRRDLRSLLEKTVLKARELAEQGAHEALTTLGVNQAKPFEHLKPEQKKLRNQLRALGRQAGDVLDERTDRQTIEHLASVVAYEHWHRMLFARFLAESGLLLESEHQVPVSLADVAELARDARIDIWDLAGRYAQRMLPAVFRPDDPVLVLTLAREARAGLEKLVADLPSEVFLASDSLGWTYQFWQADQKEIVNKSGKKIGADELSPVTQLFTEDYMVDFLLDNTLGAWHAGKVLAAKPKLAETTRSEDELRQAVALPGCPWKYLRFIQGQDGKWTSAAGTFEGWPKSAAALRALDPCMGSGHFVVAMFERLVALRLAEEKLDEVAAVAAVIRDNLFGLEIDPRCTQIGAFNLALAAWRRVGHCKLPAMNLACSGLAPNTRESDWLAIAGDNQKLQRGMERLYRLFQKAAVLGSLINPRAGEGDLLVAAFHELQPLLEKALAQETKDDTAHEMAVTARGLAKAAEILAGQFTIVATNVPYLGRPKQAQVLMDYCESVHPEGKADLATCFVERCMSACSTGGSIALVTPQAWHFLGTYKNLRRTLLTEATFDFISRLGPKGFQTPMWDFNVMLVGMSKIHPERSASFFGLDVANSRDPASKAECLLGDPILQVEQFSQINNPDSRIRFGGFQAGSLLSEIAQGLHGQGSFDDPAYVFSFWELDRLIEGWVFQQTTGSEQGYFSGLTNIFRWENGEGMLAEMMSIKAEAGYTTGKWRAGIAAWGKFGIAVSGMGKFVINIYGQQSFDTNVAVILPANPRHLLPLWCFLSGDEFQTAVRELDQNLKVSCNTYVKVPFDLAHWQKVAAEKYPHGLPKPFSSDPTQWLFNGHPAGADQPLHVAVARLLGYQWPRQTGSSFPDCPALKSDGLEKHADEDGVVCLSPVRGERGAADRLRTLLSAALGKYDEQALIKATGSKAKSFESWLNDEFFEQHCAFFHQRPFVWHIWDGLSDGFHVLINYHKLAAPNGAGRKLLETVTFTYLGDWIRKQQDGLKRNEAGAEDRLIAAQALQKELEAILAGEPPYDVFIRWKPLKRQAIGWEPDINDGVRLNIRPFLLANDVGRKGAGILRTKPNIKWDKDRGREPSRPKSDFPWFWTWDEETEDFAGQGIEPDGNRWNDCHYTTAVKRAVKAKK